MQQKQGFSPFSWALALFCLPSALWPLALFVSAKFSDSPNLTPSQIDLFSITFWVYPMVLLAISGVLYKLHKRQPNAARIGLVASFVGFYAFLGYILNSL